MLRVCCCRWRENRLRLLVDTPRQVRLRLRLRRDKLLGEDLLEVEPLVWRSGSFFREAQYPLLCQHQSFFSVRRIHNMKRGASLIIFLQNPGVCDTRVRA